MAKLGSYYGLCPLIESKGLLGISEDVEKGVVIVTLGKNIAGRYRLSDQKQVCCWKTKEKFSSPVIYDKRSSKYLAVFNHSCIKFWDCEEENLDKLKKYKFNKRIYTVFSCTENIFILFQNGNLYTLDEALESRKVLNCEEIISDNEQIEDILYVNVKNQLYVALIVRSSNEFYLYWTKYNSSKCKYTKTKLQRDSFSLRGYLFHVMGNSVKLFTLWSDGRMFSYSLQDSEEIPVLGTSFAVIQSISTKYTVCMLSLDENYIAMFGANCNEEGAILLIYNTQFKITQSKHSFKLFTNGAKLWRCENYLLLPVGHSLAVIPFYLETEQLAALIGTHKIIQNESNADVTVMQTVDVASWDNRLKLRGQHIPETLTLKINDLIIKGLPESTVAEELLFAILQDHDIDSLKLCLNYFFDISEKCLAKILKYLINLDTKAFHNQPKHASKLFPYNLQPIARSELIDKILCKRFSEILLLPYLCSELALVDVITLLNYICFLCSEDGHLLPSMNIVKTHAKLTEWSFVIIDANYQKLLLSKDHYVSEMLNQLDKMVVHHLGLFEDLKFLSTFLNYFKTKNSCNGAMTNDIKYSVEQICFY